MLAACGFGSIGVLVALALERGATLAPVLMWRYLLAAVMLAGVAQIMRAGRVPVRRAGRIVVLGGGGQALVAGLSLSALAFIPPATLTFLFYTYPAWIAIIAAVRGTERLTRWRVAALVLSLAGIAVMVGTPWGGGAPLPVAGVMLALGSGLVYALYVPMMNRLQEGLSPVSASVWIVLGAGLCFAVWTAAEGDGELFAGMPRIAWVVVVVLALFSTTFAFVAFLRGLSVLGPVRTGIVSTVEPFWTALFGGLLFAQPVTVPTLAGGALIAAGVVVLVLGSRR